MASRFFHWNTRDISRSNCEMTARNVTCIPTEKARRDLNASDVIAVSTLRNYLSDGPNPRRSASHIVPNLPAVQSATTECAFLRCNYRITYLSLSW